MNLARRVDALEIVAARHADPFAHLDDDELETLVDILHAWEAGSCEGAEQRWLGCSDDLRSKFIRTIELFKIEGAH